jgi:hypothetical protein
MVCTVTSPNSGRRASANLFSRFGLFLGQQPNQIAHGFGGDVGYHRNYACRGNIRIGHHFIDQPVVTGKNGEFGPAALAGSAHVVEISRGLFDGIDVGMILKQQSQVFGQQLGAGPPRDDIGNDG